MNIPDIFFLIFSLVISKCMSWHTFVIHFLNLLKFFILKFRKCVTMNINIIITFKL